MIAEVASAEGLRALIEGWSEEVDVAGKEKEEREGKREERGVGEGVFGT